VLGALAACAGFVLLIEMILSLGANMGAPVRLVFMPGVHAADPRSPAAWICATGLLATGLGLLYWSPRAARQ
jgi:branched-chain amino acid transport system permease protein